MIVRLGQYFRLSCIYDLFKKVESFRCIALQLLECDAGKRIRNAHLRMTLQERENETCRRNVRFFCDFFCYLPVIEIAFSAIVEILRVVSDIKHPVFLDPIWLVYLKIKTERFHTSYLYSTPLSRGP